MESAGYKSAYQQGYSDAVRDFRKEPKTDVLDKIRAEIEHMIPCSKEALSTKLGVLEIIDKYKAGNEEQKDV